MPSRRIAKPRHGARDLKDGTLIHSITHFHSSGPPIEDLREQAFKSRCSISIAMTPRPVENRHTVDLTDAGVTQALDDLTALLETAVEPRDFEDTGQGVLFLKKAGHELRCNAVLDALRTSYSVWYQRHVRHRKY